MNKNNLPIMKIFKELNYLEIDLNKNTKIPKGQNKTENFSIYKHSKK